MSSEVVLLLFQDLNVKVSLKMVGCWTRKIMEIQLCYSINHNKLFCLSNGISVSILVFRSLKQSHDVSYQGLLPPIHDIAGKLRRAIEARDSYGMVFDDVKKMQAM